MQEIGDCKAIICGKLQQETIINLDNHLFLDQPGGSLAYAAGGFRLWSDNPGLVAKTSPDLDYFFSSALNAKGFSTNGLIKYSKDFDSRAFYKIIDEDNFDSENPIKYFGLLEKPFPRNLLGYSGLPFRMENRTRTFPTTIFPEEIPGDYLDCSCVLLCSIDFPSLSMLPPYFRLNGFKKLIIKPSFETMNSYFWNDLPILARGCTGLICTRKEASALFIGKTEDLWEIAEAIANFGLEFVVITCGKDGQAVFIRSNKTRWHIPAYPTRVIDCVHASDAFAGGFLAGFIKYFDPLTAALHGNVSSSIKLEGSGAFYILDAMKELAQARLKIIREKAVKV
jgi:hypothetical protein